MRYRFEIRCQFKNIFQIAQINLQYFITIIIILVHEKIVIIIYNHHKSLIIKYTNCPNVFTSERKLFANMWCNVRMYFLYSRKKWPLFIYMDSYFLIVNKVMNNVDHCPHGVANIRVIRSFISMWIKRVPAVQYTRRYESRK